MEIIYINYGVIILSIKLAFITPWSELAELVKEISNERRESVTIVEDLNSYQMSEEWWREEGIEAIISRGPMVNLIRQKVSIPVIKCEPNAYDLLRAFSQAKNFSSNIGFINSWKIIFDKKVIEDILNLSIQTSRTCYSKEDIYKEVEWALRQGLKVVVGGTVTYEIAPKHGIRCIKLLTSREAIAESFDKAKETVRVIQEKQAEAERFRIILDTDKNGIVSINENKIITLFNTTAQEMTGISKEKIIGKSIDDFPFLSPMEDVLQHPENTNEDIVTLKNVKAVNNRVPIMVKEKVVGVVSTYQDITRLQETETRVRKELNKKGFTAKHSLNDIIGESQKIKVLIENAKEYAKKDSTILIFGETGSGKGILAQGIHLASSRRNGPFVSVNCSGLPENLLESELFGFEEGAFTGARRGGKQGLFELAHNGTVFLDEIAGTSLNLQSRLLKVVEEREVMRVGGDHVIPLDVRIIAASNKDLRREISLGNFRSDLYYRLNVLSLNLPPLRERKEDICLLFQNFLKSKGFSLKEIEVIFNKRFINELENYCWPGNVRELEHFAEKVAALCQGSSSIRIKEMQNNLLIELQENEKVDCGINANKILIPLGTLEEMENEIIRVLYRKFYGSKLKLAKQLNISRTTLWKRLESILNDESNKLKL